MMTTPQKSILLISCYELGHQPAGIWSPLAFIRRAGYHAETMDVSVEGFDLDKVRRARFVGISVPMHTALRLGVRVARRVREANRECHICFYGLYAELNREYLLGGVADSVRAGEYEESLVALIESAGYGAPPSPLPILERLNFPVADRGTLPSLATYARLEQGGAERLTGYVEASRGCLHHCAHCPIPPVYGGRFFVVPQEVVLEDIRRLAGAGAAHITFGDPDFLNGPGHSLRLVRRMREEFPELTFDFTAKVEHILKHRELFPEFGRSGCIFMVSAVESVSDTVLSRLEKGHTRADVLEALGITREAGIALRPSFVAFTPWTTLADYLDMLELVDSEGLVYHVDPVQYTIRLLVPPGSLLLGRPDTSRWLGELERESFTYTWAHPDPRMDELQKRVATLVEQAAQASEDPGLTFERICELAYEAAGRERCERALPAPSGRRPPPDRPPRLTEAWFC